MVHCIPEKNLNVSNSVNRIAFLNFFFHLFYCISTPKTCQQQIEKKKFGTITRMKIKHRQKKPTNISTSS